MSDLKPMSGDDVCDLLGKALVGRPGAATPNEDEVRELTYWINKYRAWPWSVDDVHQYRQADQAVRKERAVLDQAAEILRADLKQWEGHFDVTDVRVGKLARRRAAEIGTAILVLERSRSWFEGGLERTSRGPDQKPWAITAPKLARETLSALRQAQIRMGQKPQDGFGRPDGPIVTFVSGILKDIYPDDVPSSATVLEAIEKNLPCRQGSVGGNQAPNTPDAP